MLPRPNVLALVRAPKHRLLVVCTAVLGTGMLCVLLLNTMISQGAFRQHELELALIHASESQERLSREVQLAEAPLEVERRARVLGMVPAAAPVFLRLSDGTVLGDPVPAPASGKVSFAGAPGWVTPKPAASASPSTSAQPSAGAQPSVEDQPSAGAQASAGTSPSPAPSGSGQAPPAATGNATPDPTAATTPGPTDPATAPPNVRPTPHWATP